MDIIGPLLSAARLPLKYTRASGETRERLTWLANKRRPHARRARLCFGARFCAAAANEEKQEAAARILSKFIVIASEVAQSKRAGGRAGGRAWRLNRGARLVCDKLSVFAQISRFDTWAPFGRGRLRFELRADKQTTWNGNDCGPEEKQASERRSRSSKDDWRKTTTLTGPSSEPVARVPQQNFQATSRASARELSQARPGGAKLCSLGQKCPLSPLVTRR